jgi:hypothetical protein
MFTTPGEIPPRFWQPFFGRVAYLYQGWNVTIEVLGDDLGDQPLLEGLPLRGLTFERAGSEAGSILIEAGDGSAFTIHRIENPWRVQEALLARPGMESDVYIESEDGTATLVVLRSVPALPPGMDLEFGQ